MKTFIKLYGARNTGTNYVSALVALNLAASQARGMPSVSIETSRARKPVTSSVKSDDDRHSCSRARLQSGRIHH